MPPCSTCGNTFIECFGSRKSWWVGCKPCNNHVRAKTRWEARRKWKRRHIDKLMHGEAKSPIVNESAPEPLHAATGSAAGLRIRCDCCATQMAKLGALMFSPPRGRNRVGKYHVCLACWELVRGFIIIKQPNDKLSNAPNNPTV